MVVTRPAAIPRVANKRRRLRLKSRIFETTMGSSDALIEKTLQIYGDDVRLFYNDVSADHLIQNKPLPAINTLHSKGLKLSNWLRELGFGR